MPDSGRFKLARRHTDGTMSKLLLGTAILAIAVGAAWFGGETWLSNRVGAMVGDNPQIAASEVSPLRNPARVGLRMRDVEYGDAENGFSAPGMEVYAPLTAPNTLTVDLPNVMALRVGATPFDLTLAEGVAQASFAPTHGLAIRSAGLTARELSLGGAQMLGAADLAARQVHRGSAAPAGSATAYNIDISVQDIALAGLADRLQIAGPVQAWLSAVPDRRVLEGAAPPPSLTGIQTHGVEFKLGRMQARLLGRVEADANGFASGEAAFYTDDAQGFIDAAVTAGLIPENGALLARALIHNMAGTSLPGDAEEPAAEDLASTSAEVAEEAAEATEIFTDEAVSLPRAEPGQIRLPLILKDGEMRLGPVPLGPAPRLLG